MSAILSQSILVVLTGVYALRASSFIFSGYVSPLMPVAALVLCLCVALFHRPPSGPGAWLTFAIVGSVVGTVANVALLFSTHEAYRTPTSLAFSAVSAVGWVLLAALYALMLFDRSPAAT